MYHVPVLSGTKSYHEFPTRVSFTVNKELVEFSGRRTLRVVRGLKSHGLREIVMRRNAGFAHGVS